ncbi:DUF1570 domain-containing protein [Leptolyngbya sp. 15MV]|nr:DUF1570 domain-containing protein [Leptolyngbya sp. 15MV]
MRFLLMFFAALALAAPLRAEWHEASSEHFVVYADDSARNVQTFAEMLERYHTAMTLLTGREVETPSPSNRVTIFAVGNENDVRRLVGGNARNVAGFYIPRAGASRAFVPNIRISYGELDWSMIVLLHEYAHHFLISSSRYAMPRWLSEGSAEFFASASYGRDGSMMVGRPAAHRYGELAFAADVSVEELLDHELYEQRRGRRYDAFYGRSWALYHFLFFEPTRQGQLKRYVVDIMQGTPPRQAATDAFGDLGVLGRDLNRYLRRPRLLTFDLKPEMLPIGPVTVRKVSPGHAAALPQIIRSQRGVNDEQAADILPRARAVAARFPDDAWAQAALAEAAFDAGEDDEAITAADRAIALDPSITNAYVQKGFALFRKARDAEDRAAAYAAAMAPFSALNQIENDHPLPLIHHYRSYTERGREPPESARHALERASQLAPFDQGLAMEVGLMQASEGKIEVARYTLAPLAADPHGGSFADRVRMLVRALDRAEEGKPFDASSVLASYVEVDVPTDTAGE